MDIKYIQTVTAPKNWKNPTIAKPFTTIVRGGMHFTLQSGWPHCARYNSHCARYNSHCRVQDSVKVLSVTVRSLDRCTLLCSGIHKTKGRSVKAACASSSANAGKLMDMRFTRVFVFTQTFFRSLRVRLQSRVIPRYLGCGSFWTDWTQETSSLAWARELLRAKAVTVVFHGFGWSHHLVTYSSKTLKSLERTVLNIQYIDAITYMVAWQGRSFATLRSSCPNCVRSHWQTC